MEWIPVALVVILVLYFIIAYNKLVKVRNMLKEAWSGIDVQLKRRSDLIPSLVETVKGYSSHEQDLLLEIVEKRAAALAAQGTKEKGEAENALTAGIKNIFALAEAYPDLKASDNFLHLQQELINVEDQIQLARRYYNGTVRLLNNRVESFPSNLIAKITGFSRAEFFTLELATERTAPEISWDEK
ncbi:MAG: LemA family protein [Bacillota bacterium]|nr:LemA family protein [Bacillota bacterium]HOC06906.1 LemA family protein [Bacillota bacterium]HPZ22500.1 LemA family protein [Bacillota bacterium]HQD20057.1 LemA family protein [Bacillota bacterium]